VSEPVSVITGHSIRELFLNWSKATRNGRGWVNMTSRGADKGHKVSEFGASPIQSHSDKTSGNQTPSSAEIRLRAYEISLERGGLPDDELDDWLRAEPDTATEGCILAFTLPVDHQL
jgi:hypothetical protein